MIRRLLCWHDWTLLHVVNLNSRIDGAVVGMRLYWICHKCGSSKKEDRK